MRDRLGHGLKNADFMAEFSVDELDAEGFLTTNFYLPETFPTQESAIELRLRLAEKVQQNAVLGAYCGYLLCQNPNG
jgi:hypothetical protein